MIQDGSEVSFHYTLTVDEEQVESSEGRDPLSYTHGQGQIIPGLEEALAGLDVGDTREVELPPEKAYGPRDPAAVREVPKEAFGSTDGLSVGDVVRGQAGEQEFQATVVGLGDEAITLDLNHPLAGRTLRFSVEIVGVA
jgi:FKBP-type peptidyl-prolyl cis-trans isomerase 2